MAQHTPGPWEAGRNPKGVCSNEWVVRPRGEFPHGAWVADCGYSDEGIANAHLIAAAPDLLGALKLISAMLEGDKGTSGTYYPKFTGTLIEAVTIARKAIAAAEPDAEGRS